MVTTRRTARLQPPSSPPRRAPPPKSRLYTSPTSGIFDPHLTCLDLSDDVPHAFFCHICGPKADPIKARASRKPQKKSHELSKARRCQQYWRDEWLDHHRYGMRRRAFQIRKIFGFEDKDPDEESSSEEEEEENKMIVKEDMEESEDERAENEEEEEIVVVVEEEDDKTEGEEEKMTMKKELEEEPNRTEVVSPAPNPQTVTIEKHYAAADVTAVPTQERDTAGSPLRKRRKKVAAKKHVPKTPVQHFKSDMGSTADSSKTLPMAIDKGPKQTSVPMQMTKRVPIIEFNLTGAKSAAASVVSAIETQANTTVSTIELKTAEKANDAKSAKPASDATSSAPGRPSPQATKTPTPPIITPPSQQPTTAHPPPFYLPTPVPQWTATPMVYPPFPSGVIPLPFHPGSTPPPYLYAHWPPYVQDTVRRISGTKHPLEQPRRIVTAVRPPANPTTGGRTAGTPHPSAMRPPGVSYAAQSTRGRAPGGMMARFSGVGKASSQALGPERRYVPITAPHFVMTTPGSQKGLAFAAVVTPGTEGPKPSATKHATTGTKPATAPTTPVLKQNTTSQTHIEK